jgi:hypothetical protein
MPNRQSPVKKLIAVVALGGLVLVSCGGSDNPSIEDLVK